MFAAIGDFGTDDERQRRVSDLVGSWGPDFIITAGDNRYGNRSMDAVIGGHYCDWLNGVQGGDLCSGKASSVNRFFPSAGNHDYRDGGGISEYTDYFTLPGVDIESTNTSGTELYYDFVQGPVHFFAIDSHGASKDTQKEWLEKTSVASASKWKIVFFHHAAYSSSSAHGSDSSMQWDFAAWGVDAVIAGHDHTYERIEHDGVLYFVNGLGGRSIYELGQPVEGSQVRYNEDNGAMRITADSAEMTFEFVATSGTVIDSRTIR
jgi:predicted phosphodiesterase